MALLALLIGPRVGRGRLRHLALVPIPAALLQVLIEGQRWQLVPLYALAAVLVLGWLFRTVRPRRPPPTRRAGTVVLAVVGTLALVITAVPPVLVPVFSFPEPTGPYGIGTETYHWTDQSREDIFTEDPNDHRELVAQLWYPEAPGFPAPAEAYVDDVAAMRPIAVSQGLPAFAFSHFGLIRSHARHHSWLAAPAAPYPVLIFVHGRGGYRQQSTRQVEQLVSAGLWGAVDRPARSGRRGGAARRPDRHP